MTPPSIWTEETRVNANDTDFEGKWKPTRMLQVMQEAGNTHANLLGVGFHELAAKNQAWVLSRLKIKFIRFPAIDEMITIQTWPKGIQQKIFFDRHFKLTDEKGQNIALASSAYLLIDTKARKMLLPSALEKDLPRQHDLSAMDELLEKIVIPDSVQEHMRFNATYGTIDVMGHVNNTRYLEWITDCFPLDHYQTYKLDWVQINYANEIKPAENVSLALGLKSGEPSTWLVQGTNLTAENRAFEASLGWSKRN
jgi:medium-chain acyl-[acyl-carrier-protein] hydrolase